MKSRILVVDDERAASFLIQQIFREEVRNGDYELTFVENGAEALDTLEADDAFHLVLTDINMPRMDGLTMLSHVKRSYPHVLVIMVTAYSDMAKVRRSMNLGAYDYLIKPIEPSDMKKTVDRALKLVHRRS